MTTREYKSLGAASTRSTEIELIDRALSCHSLRDHLTATMRDKAGIYVARLVPDQLA